jgi:hypothetical protein
MRLFIILFFICSIAKAQSSKNVYYVPYISNTVVVVDSTSELTSSAAGTPDNEWSGGASVYSSNDTWATATSAGLKESVYNFNIPDLTGKTIVGIKLQIEGSCEATATNVLGIELTYNGGTSWTTSGNTNTYTTITDTYKVYGSSTDLWGHSWIPSELTNANFKVRMTLTSKTQTMYVDHVGKLRIYYY